MNAMLAFLLVFFISNPHIYQYETSYDIDEIYESITPDLGTLAKTSFGEIVELELLFVETDLDIGKFSITVSREDDDFYKVDGTNYYLKTRYCYEYAYFQDAILIIDSQSGYTKGRIIFIE